MYVEEQRDAGTLELLAITGFFPSGIGCKHAPIKKKTIAHSKVGSRMIHYLRNTHIVYLVMSELGAVLKKKWIRRKRGRCTQFSHNVSLAVIV